MPAPGVSARRGGIKAGLNFLSVDRGLAIELGTPLYMSPERIRNPGDAPKATPAKSDKPKADKAKTEKKAKAEAKKGEGKKAESKKPEGTSATVK